MSCCITDLGRLGHNEDLDLQMQVQVAGTYRANIQFASATIVREFELAAGDDLIIPGPWNEDFVHTLEIEDPDGTLIMVDYCTTIQFKTYLRITNDCNDPCAPADESSGDYS